MTSTAMNLLGDVIAPYPGGLDLSARVDVAVALMVEDAELPLAVTEAIAGFLESATEDQLRRVQEAVVRSGLWMVGPDRFVCLLAQLTADRYLKLEEAARLLAGIPHVERRRLPPAAVHLIHVADAVVEDAKDGVMQIDDDQIFRDAVQGFLTTPAFFLP